MTQSELVTLAEWQQQFPEKWARIEGSVTRQQMRTLKFLDAQIHLTRERTHHLRPPDTPEVRWLRRCILLYLFVMAHGCFPRDERSVVWVKNQRRGSLCDYQVACLMQIPGWKWAPRRLEWEKRAEDLNAFRSEYGREPRVRSIWEVERALAHWYSRQKQAAVAGKLTPNQVAKLEGDEAQPTGEIVWARPTFAGSYEAWFREFWAGLSQVGD